MKNGARTVEVRREYQVTAGRIGNAQVEVYLVGLRQSAWASVHRPQVWTSYRDRCGAAGVRFATKPALANDHCTGT